MTHCYVVGNAGPAGETAKLLRHRGLAVKAFEPGVNDAGFFEACSKEKGLVVVVVFLKSIKKDIPAFFKNLRDSLAKGVGVHLLTQGAPISDFTRSRVTKITTLFLLEPFHADRAVTADWFSHFKKEETRNTLEIGPEETKTHEKRTTRTVDWKGIGNSSVKESVTETKPSGISSIASVQQAPETLVILPVSVPKQNEGDSGVLTRLLKVLKKNCPLPAEPVVVNIVGKAGTSQNLDPRRVRPLPKQPRHRDNNGFTQGSLTELAETIKTFGQLDDASVCPIVGDPDYDAQLIDGERRHNACLYAGVMMKATVREDVTPAMASQLYLLSVVRNFGKVPHTTVEYVDMVHTFLGPDFEMTTAEIAQILGKSYTHILMYKKLSMLHPDVLAKVGENTSKESKGTKANPKKEGRKLTANLALLLIDVPFDEQLCTAQVLIDKCMSDIEARRYLLSIRRGMNIKRNSRHGWQSKTFRAITTLSKKNIDAFGVFGDMTEAEMLAVVSSRNAEERCTVAKNLQVLAENIRSLANRIAAGEKKV